MPTIKICGITQPDQALAIAHLGVSYLGFILVSSSPRFVPPHRLPLLTAHLPPIGTVGVFLDCSYQEILSICKIGNLTGIQLHGNESPEFCQILKEKCPDRLIIKALRIRDSTDLDLALIYGSIVDVILLDAYDPRQAGGTGKTIPWEILSNFQPPCPWWLAGGLQPSNVGNAIQNFHPDGIDLSSGVENKPGCKNLAKVAAVVNSVKTSS